ncbi:MAG TPA: DUF262 domain-containing protein [Polyangia bacterium]|nr:DUF262 domain-containing protein [Polyangia bacterium]
MDAGRIHFGLRGIGTELKERLLAVPVYQRSYAWTSEEVSEFWADLRDALAVETPEYFLGTIVLTRGEATNRATVIDGQQRLATTAILLAAIRDEFRDRGDTKRRDIIQADYLSTSDLESAQEVAKLQLNSEDSVFFERRIVQADELVLPTKDSHKLILSAYDFLRERVKSSTSEAGVAWAKRLNQWVAYLRDKAMAMVLSVPSDADAYLIFETLNDRGADLTIADLLKNYLFGHAGTKLNAVRDGWMQVLGALEISAENSLFTTFLRHYWSSHHGATRERELYKSIKEHVATEKQVVEFIADLQSAAQLYSALLSTSHEYWDELGGTVRANVESLLRLDLEQNRPLLLAALQHLQTKEKKRLLRSLVSWSVRGVVVGGIGGGTAEKAYCRAAMKIRKGEIKTTVDVLTEIKAIVPSDADFRDSFMVFRVPKAGLARYFLIALEKTLRGEDEPEFVPNANEDQVNLEHVLPKRASKADWGSSFNSDERKDYLHRLGNLALLQKGPNGLIGNKPFVDKKTVLKKSTFKLTAEVADNSDWTKEKIAERQERLAKLATRTWPL